MPDLSVKVLKDNTAAVIAELERRCFGADLRAAEAVRGEAALHSPVRTGSNKNSAYVSTKDGGDYAEAAEESRAVNPDVVILPEVKPVGKESAVVSFAAGHDYLIEMGTHGRAPRPLLEPAAERFREFHRDELKKELPAGTR